MNSIETMPAVEALGWTLVHFLWQGALVALMLALARVALKRRTANLRYLASCAGANRADGFTEKRIRRRFAHRRRVDPVAYADLSEAPTARVILRGRAVANLAVDCRRHFTFATYCLRMGLRPASEELRNMSAP